MKSAFGLTSCADDGKEDIPVSGTGFCEFESRSAYFLYTGDGTGILARLRTGYLRVRISPCVR